MSEEHEARIAELERKVEALTEALVAAAGLSVGWNGPRIVPKPDYRLNGTKAIRDALVAGGLIQ